ncbi:unnamed protein product [Adineta steineri]|uniref:Uncharacterized protein n=1 Tax=Adineta steineri TaxID=433720 RepID=A0A816AT89_9BILA|nr:unnamed protein product [Adineta steineri]CAF1601611.1 unnamed protein product [Adineta steineri]
MMEILTKFIIIVAISAIYVQGKISSTKIKNDAAKMVEIYQIYIMPSRRNTVNDIFSAQCTVLTSCCGVSGKQLFNILDSHALEEKCLNRPALPLSKPDLSLCPHYKERLDMITKSSEYSRFLKLHSGVPGSDQLIRNWRSRMKKACYETELHHYYCLPELMDSFQSCQEKMLQSLANENGGKNYDAFVRNWINDFTTFNKRIAKEFPQST